MSKQIYIDIDHNGIGDRIQFAAIPEAFYKWYGVRLIDLNKSWVFDHNPYVDRDVEARLPDYKPIRINFSDNEPYAHLCCKATDWVNPDIRGHRTVFIEKKNKKDNILMFRLYPAYREEYVSSSRNNWLYEWLGIHPYQNPKLDLPRSPRLYKYEDPNDVVQDQIAIHIGRGVSTTQYIPHNVIEEIRKRYSNYKIIQVGGEQDNDSPFIDKRAQSIWEMVEIIAKSAIFIGINSGPMNIANCYPHINKKLILNYAASTWDEDSIARFEPLGGHISHNYSWCDHGWQYYNTEEHDIGMTYSYKRI